jgi:hypothetical protein
MRTLVWADLLELVPCFPYCEVFVFIARRVRSWPRSCVVCLVFSHQCLSVAAKVLLCRPPPAYLDITLQHPTEVKPNTVSYFRGGRCWLAAQYITSNTHHDRWDWRRGRLRQQKLWVNGVVWLFCLYIRSEQLPFHIHPSSITSGPFPGPQLNLDTLCTRIPTKGWGAIFSMHASCIKHPWFVFRSRHIEERLVVCVVYTYQYVSRRIILSRTKGIVWRIWREVVLRFDTEFDTRHLQFLSTPHTGAVANYSANSAVAVSHYLQFTIHALDPLGLLSHTTPLVPASNGGRSLSCVPKLSPRLAVCSLSPSYVTASSCPDLYCRELYPVTNPSCHWVHPLELCLTTIELLKSSWICDQRSVFQSVLVSGIPLRPMITLCSFLSCDSCFVLVGRPLWWGDESVVCSAIGHKTESQWIHHRVLLSHLRLLSSLFVASFCSQALRWRYSILTLFHTEIHWNAEVAVKLLYSNCWVSSA